MRRRTVLAVTGALLLAVAAAVVARAADAPAAAPAMLPKLDHPFVRALLGEWDVTATGPMGESRARSTMSLVLGDTTLAHEWTGDAFGAPYHGHGLYRLTSDGKRLVCWWFDSHSPEPLKMIGPVSDSKAELSGSGPAGPVTIVWKVEDGAVEWTMSSGGTVLMKQAYRRATK
ncbi:MAG: DUF1579 family protein [Planctomycetota bacterium]